MKTEQNRHESAAPFHVTGAVLAGLDQPATAIARSASSAATTGSTFRA